MVPDTEAPTGPDGKANRNDRYSTARAAVRDGVLDAIGTVALLGFSLVCLFVGTRGFVVGSSPAISGGFVVASCLLAAAAFDLVPPFRG